MGKTQKRLNHLGTERILFFGPSHPILNFLELITDRDIDSDGDSGWSSEKSPDDSSGNHEK